MDKAFDFWGNSALLHDFADFLNSKGASAKLADCGFASQSRDHQGGGCSSTSVQRGSGFRFRNYDIRSNEDDTSYSCKNPDGGERPSKYDYSSERDDRYSGEDGGSSGDDDEKRPQIVKKSWLCVVANSLDLAKKLIEFMEAKKMGHITLRTSKKTIKITKQDSAGNVEKYLEENQGVFLDIDIEL